MIIEIILGVIIISLAIIGVLIIPIILDDLITKLENLLKE